MSTIAQTFDDFWTKVHSKESASASEMSKIAETVDEFWIKVLQNLGFR